MIALQQGDYRQAHSLLREAMIHNEGLGNRMNDLWLRVRLGYVVLRMGNFREACTILAKTAHEFLNDNSEIGVIFTLEGTAELFLATGKPEHAARLIGWADATRKKIGDKRPLLEQADVDRIVAACLEKMGEAAFSDVYDHGQKMSLAEAVAYALSETNKM
jgi:hypothetical protein